MSAEAAFEVGRLFAPLKQIADTLTATQKDVFVELPGLAGYYPMSVRNGSGHAVEHSGSGSHLLQTGTCPTGYDGNAFVQLGNGTNYLNVVTTYAITGTETWISSSLRGLTIGGWFMLDSVGGSSGGLVSKDAAPPNRGYFLVATTTPTITFAVSAAGGSGIGVTSASTTMAEWHFIVGRFTPATEVAVFVDGDKTVNVTAIPASANVSSGNFEVGRFSSLDANIQHCKARDVFICATALSDDLIETVRNSTRP